MIHRHVEFWTAGIVSLLLSQQMSLAELKKSSPSSDTSSKRAVARLDSPSFDEDDATSASDRPRGTRKAGRTLLTAADEPIVPDSLPPEPPESVYSQPLAACVTCPQFWEHTNAVWGEFLFLRARGADVTYATPVDGTLATSVPVGDRLVSAFDYDAGFRVGGAWAIDKCSSLTANYTWFRNATDDSVSLPGGGGAFLLAETVHPNTINVAADSLAATAHSEVNLQAADLNYKAIIWGEEDYALNYLVGVKYARLEQQFAAEYQILGTTNVDTNVNFNGTGPRFGLEGERRCGCHGFMVYSKGAVNFLVGSSTAQYIQTNVFTGIQARTAQHDSRIVTMPELELGGGWQNCSGCFRITAGYYMAAWFNMMTTPEYLSIVRSTQNSFQDQVKTLTLDGLTVRAEYRF